MNSRPIAYEMGCNAGLEDARRHDQDPECFEPRGNPFGCNSEPIAHSWWAEGYENTFEANKGRP